MLQWLGAAAVLAVFGAGIAALAIVKDRVSVTIAADAGDAAPDPLGLVRDDLRQLHRDVDALANALGQNFGELVRTLEGNVERHDARAAELRAAVRQLAERDALAAVRAELAALQSAVAALAPAAERLAGEPAPAAPTASPDPEPPADPEPPVEEPATDPVAVEAAPEQKRTGFLSFTLPSRRLEAHLPQHWRILADLSRVGYDAKSTLHDFSGVTSKVDGEFDAALGDPDFAWNGMVRCDAATLRTGVDGRDGGMREHLDTVHFPAIEFALRGFRPAESGFDAVERTVAGVVHGTMTIRGQSRALEMGVECRVDESQRLVVTGQAPLRLTDFGVPVPSQLGLISMEDEVVVWVSLRARSIGPARREN